MAGGIFVDQPFYANPKCILFALTIMLIYWFSPQEKSPYMLPVLFVVSYVAMAWYDYAYNCDTPLLSGYSIGPNTFDAIFKPQDISEDKIPDDVKLRDDQIWEYRRRVYLFHILAILPMIIYVGYNGSASDERIFPALKWTGAFGLIYHVYMLSTRGKTHHSH